MSSPFIFLLADAYSRELFNYLKEKLTDEMTLTPMDLCHFQQWTDTDLEANAVLYVPSVAGEEGKFFGSYPALRRVAILDLFHFDFKDFKNHFVNFHPFQVFSPQPLNDSSISITICPSFQKEMILTQSPRLTTSEETKVCFISQPLLEERSQLGFHQHDLIETLAPLLSHDFSVKIHPRENYEYYKNSHLIFKGSPVEALESFTHFIGYNSALLYSAETLGLPVLKISSLSEITPDNIKNFLQKKRLAPNTYHPGTTDLLAFMKTLL